MCSLLEAHSKSIQVRERFDTLAYRRLQTYHKQYHRNLTVKDCNLKDTWNQELSQEGQLSYAVKITEWIRIIQQITKRQERWTAMIKLKC